MCIDRHTEAEVKAAMDSINNSLSNLTTNLPSIDSVASDLRAAWSTETGTRRALQLESSIMVINDNLTEIKKILDELNNSKVNYSLKSNKEKVGVE